MPAVKLAPNLMSKPRKVVISFDTHTPYLAFRVSRLAAELRRRGLEDQIQLRVILIAGKETTYGWEGSSFEEQYGGVPVKVLTKTFRGLGLRGYFRFTTVKTTLKFFWNLIKLRPKIVLVGGYDRPESMIAGFTAWLFRWRVGVMHDSRFNDAESFSKSVVLERLKSHVLRRYHFFMCSGNECVEYSHFLAGRKKPAYHGGWNVVDNEAIGERASDPAGDAAIYQHLGVKEGAPFFLMAIRFIAKKNVETVLDAYASYRAKAAAKPAKLVICGQGELDEAYSKKIAELELGEDVAIVPWLEYNQVPRASRLSLSVILASTHDQWGLIVNEALAAGAPVLVSDRCGAHELVQNGVNGFTFAPRDAAHLAVLFGEVAERDGLVDRLREGAAPSMRSFSIDQFLGACFAAFGHFGLLPGETAARGVAEKHKEAAAAPPTA